MDINLEIEPASQAQVYFLNSQYRNILFNSGYGAGKTFIACFKLLLLLLKFPKSRAVIGREKYTDLMKTTVETFFQVCPPALYEESNGGQRNRERVRLINGSEIFFMHFQDVDLNSVKSLEINFLLLDQAEEIMEAVYLGLDSRLGRKSDAEVPQDLLDANPDWPRNKHTGRPLVPPYAFILINPPDEGEMHYLIQRFHPTSPEWQTRWRTTNDYVWSSSRDNRALSEENLQNMLTRDPEWVERYVDGKIGQGEGVIHRVHPDSIIDVEPEFISNLRKKASLMRILDHGATSPTCCLWFASWKGFYFCYQEYYVPDSIISIHRSNIYDLSKDPITGQWDYYSNNLADPQIFKKELQKYGGFWTVANEYADSRIEGPPLYWNPADNNEFATRNRINELLRWNPDLTNPITGLQGSPKIFFIKKSELNPNGCFHAIQQLKAQKKQLLDTVNGKNIYADDRDDKIVDHAYDCVRYFCASHLSNPVDAIRQPPERSFAGIQRRLKALKQVNYFERFVN